jgi:hypothetical protein
VTELDPSTFRAAAAEGTPPAPSHDAEQRVGLLQGDRLCTKCHYNLTGQSIVRESHYGLLIVRCPECGTVASVQEYPLLGKWSSRWATLTAAAFLLFVTLLFAATVLVIFGFSMGATQHAAWRLSSVLDQKFQIWQAEQITVQDPAAQSWQVWQQMYQSWWQQQDLARIVGESGGWLSVIGWQPFLLWLPLGLLAMLLGVTWSAVLLHMNRRMRLMFAGLVVGTTAVVASAFVLDWLQAEMYLSWMIAQRVVGPLMFATSIAVGGLMFVIGLMIGRPVVRAFVRAMLPPRLRGALAILWLADGLPPPGLNR